MSDYNKITNFTIKDSLPSGNTSKIIKGTEIDNEFNAIQSAVASKADTNSPAFTGTPIAPTAAAGTNTTQVATTAFVTSSPTINNANLTGTPVAPTAAAATNTTQVATTAHVFAERTNTATLTNKTINLTSNTLVATSAQLAAALTDETGTGVAVFGTAPTISNANLTGVPVAPTATAGTNTTQVATTAYVDTKVIATAGVADSAITTAKINDGAVTTVKITDANVTADKLASNSVTTAKITDSNVTTAKLADNAVTTAKITDANVTTAKIADANVTTAKIADASVTPAKLSQPITLGTSVATNVGASVDITGIPSWAKRITVMLNGVSTSGTSIKLLQLGTSGGYQTTGYTGSHDTFQATPSFNNITQAGFPYESISSAATLSYGQITFVNMGSNTWTVSGQTAAITSGTGRMAYLAGLVTLTGTLTSLRLTTVNGTDVYDAGSVNIMYE